MADSVVHFLLLLCLPVAYLLGRAVGFTRGWRSADRLLDERDRQISELRGRLADAAGRPAGQPEEWPDHLGC